jgi:hypothetical protein
VIALVGALACVALSVTILVFFPGYLTDDTASVYGDIQKHYLGDWQSPVMTIVWSLIDPISPGSGSMFLLNAALYWSAFGIIALVAARVSAPLAIAVLLLAFVPPAFMLLAMIWRDILFAVVWLFAAAITYLVADRMAPWRLPVQGLALVLIVLGVLVRPNAIIAAPLLVAYVLWPAHFAWKRTALLFIPAAIAGYVLIQIVYYGVLGVHRQNPLHSLLVFDLGGITYFTQQNQFPVSWTADEAALLVTQCYDPARWDSYWTLDPCKFVMERLERKNDVIFGTPRLTQSWLRAIAAHPLAYFSHRLTVLWTFLAGSNPTLELEKIEFPEQVPLARNPYFMRIVALHDALKSTILFRAGAWLVFAAAVGGLAWRGRRTSSGAFAVGITSSGIVYLLSFGIFGVAADFRYAYWCVLAGLAGLVPALLAHRGLSDTRRLARSDAALMSSTKPM